MTSAPCRSCRGSSGIAESERDRPVNALPAPARGGDVDRRRVPGRPSRPRTVRRAGARARRRSNAATARRSAAVVHRRRQRPPAVVRARGDLHAEGVRTARHDRLGSGGDGAAAPRADARLRHPRGQAAVHAAVHRRRSARSISTRSPIRADRGRLGRRRRAARDVARPRPRCGARAVGRRAARRRRRRRRARHGDRTPSATGCCATTPTASSTSPTTSAGSTSRTASRTPRPPAGTTTRRWRGDAGTTPDLVRLALYTAFLAQWTGRHEWHTGVGDEARGRAARARPRHATARAAAHVAARRDLGLHRPRPRGQDEPRRLGRGGADRFGAPARCHGRFMAAPKLERFVAATVERSIDFLNGRTPRD